jgi:succinate dehydrogenase hydrophobic anchor subunit
MMGARTQMDLGTLMRWIFFPNSFHVVTSVAEIEPGWTNNTWRIMQMLVALLGLTHGFNGLREVLEDYIKGNGWQIAIRILILFMWLFMLWAAYWLIQTG